MKLLAAFIVASLPLLLAGCASRPTAKDTVSTVSSIRSQLPGRWDWADASPRCGDSAADLSFAVWDLVLLDPDQFCWHRADWKSDVCTKPLRRCSQTNVAAATDRTEATR